MPPQPVWFHRLPQIIADLENLPAPVIDRTAIERLFGVRRRRAIELMHQFEGYQLGRTFLVHRTKLIVRLREISLSPEYTWQCRRKQRIEQLLDQLRAQRAAAAVSLPVRSHARDSTLAALSPDVTLEPGRLQVTFTSAEDLLAKLYDLAQAIANDFPAFQRLLR